MRWLIIIFMLTAALHVTAQRKTAIKPAGNRSPARSVNAKVPGTVPVKSEARVYRNSRFGFEITFPDNWTIADATFDAEMRGKGFDLALKAPETLAPQTKAQVNRALRNVTVLLTAFRTRSGASDSAIVRVSSEDLSDLPQVRDAVDYFDLMRSQYRAMKLPADFSYSETGAEKLGTKQFAFLDTNSTAGKKRMYATVKNRHAIIFTLSYRNIADLQAFRRILSQGNFFLK